MKCLFFAIILGTLISSISLMVPVDHSNDRYQRRIRDSINYEIAKKVLSSKIWAFESRYYLENRSLEGYNTGISYCIINKGDSCYVELPIHTSNGRYPHGHWGKVEAIKTSINKKGTIIHEFEVITSLRKLKLTINLPKGNNVAGIDTNADEHYTGIIIPIESSKRALELLNAQ
jgi:hypothetical protein